MKGRFMKYVEKPISGKRRSINRFNAHSVRKLTAERLAQIESAMRKAV